MYTKTTWVDRLVQFANRYTKSGETSTEVTLVSSPGTVTQAGTAINATNLNKIETGIFDAHTRLDEAATVPATLKHGLNAVTTTQATGAELTVGGRTLVNLIGKDGNFETDTNADGLADGWTSERLALSLQTSAYVGSKSQRMTVTNDTYANITRTTEMKTGKYYILLFKAKSSNSTTIWTRLGADTDTRGLIAHTVGTDWTLGYRKISLTVDAPQVQFYVSATTAATATVDIDGACLYEVSAADYALIGVDADWTGDKLAEKLPYVDSVQHSQGAAVRKSGKNLLPPFTQWELPSGAEVVDPYKLKISHTSGVSQANASIQVIGGSAYTLSIGNKASAAGVQIDVVAYDANGTFIFDSAGISGTSGYETVTFPSSAVRAVVRCLADNSPAGTYAYDFPQLELGSAATPFVERNDDYAYIPTILASNVDRSVVDTYNSALGTVTRRWKTLTVDGSTVGWNSGDFTGLKEVYFPLPGNREGSDRAVKYDGKVLQSTTSALADTTYLNATNMHIRISDTDSGWTETMTLTEGEINAYFRGWKMCDAAGATYVSGTKYWKKITDGTGITSTLPTASYTGYTPYKFDYQLTTAVEEVLTGDVGAISLHNGGNQVELLEGVVVREKANPVQNTDTTWAINRSSSPTAASILKNRVNNILAVYKNGVIDRKWKWFVDGSLSYGKEFVYTTNADYDTTADYYVTYVVLDKYAYTANAITATTTYQSTLGAAVAKATQDIADIKTVNGVQNFAIDYAEAKADNLRIDYDTTLFKSAATGADLNTLTTTGNHEVQSGTNGPGGAPAWLYVRVIKSATTNYVTQTAYSREDNRTWTRRKVNNVWSAWTALHVTAIIPGAGGTTFVSTPGAVTNTPSNMAEVDTYKTQVDGKFKVSGQFRTSNSGTTATAALLHAYQGALSAVVILSANTTSTTFVSFSFDSTTVLPAFSKVEIGLQATGSAYVEMQNRVISGDYFYGPISDG